MLSPQTYYQNIKFYFQINWMTFILLQISSFVKNVQTTLHKTTLILNVGLGKKIKIKTKFPNFILLYFLWTVTDSFFNFCPFSVYFAFRSSILSVKHWYKPILLKHFIKNVSAWIHFRKCNDVFWNTNWNISHENVKYAGKTILCRILVVNIRLSTFRLSPYFPNINFNRTAIQEYSNTFCSAWSCFIQRKFRFCESV